MMMRSWASDYVEQVIDFHSPLTALLKNPGEKWGGSKESNRENNFPVICAPSLPRTYLEQLSATLPTREQYIYPLY
jgi:hypothetical protein